MSSIKEALWTVLNNMNETNFTVLRNGENIGTAVAIPVGEKFIEIVKTSTELLVGDCLVDRNNKKFVVTDVSLVDGRTRVHFSVSE